MENCFKGLAFRKRRKRIENINTDFLEGIVNRIEVSATYSKNRDGIVKQVGHQLKVKFKLSIVDDKLVWKDEKDKNKGYDVLNGKKELTLNQEISLGGRGKK